MATTRYTYELETQRLTGRITVHRLRGATLRQQVAVFENFKDACDFKRMKEAQGQAASERNRRANRARKFESTIAHVPG